MGVLARSSWWCAVDAEQFEALYALVFVFFIAFGVVSGAALAWFMSHVR